MTNLNHVVVEGNITRDALDDMKRSQSNDVAFGSFTLAVNRSYKEGEEWKDKTSFFKVKGFGKGYENACKHMTKGSSVTVEGHLEQECWEKDGQKRSEIVIIADRIYPTYKKGGEGNGGNSKPKTESKTVQNDDGFPEDMPF